jgi:carbamoyl-phosphate synthase small subunit
MERQKAYLVLEDGKVFEGLGIGKVGTVGGEIAFNTGMTGYQEVYTDPSYLGQILIMTTSHIGNYGVHESETESDSLKIAGIVTKKFSDDFSRESASGSLNDYLLKDGKVGISDIDTRALVRYVRDKGAMNAIISSENHDVDSLIKEVKDVPSMDGMELASKVSTKEAYTSGEESAVLKVACLDYGVKRNIVKCLTDRGCFVKVFPLTATLDDIKAFNPNGIMLSNGPGDPSVMPNEIENVKTFVDSGIPIFGICLGHQLLSLSQGLETEKMHNGHRGLNHPIKNLITGKGEITSQNHGFVVKRSMVEERDDIELTHVHLNDNTVAGIELKGKPVFSVQYHPEASAGPHDSRYLFDQFIDNMKKNN